MPGIPIEPALATPVRSVADIAKKFRDMEYTCEHKYDGERAQIHYMEDGGIEIYSRRLERSTEKFPDIGQAVAKMKNPYVKSFILDCEIVAYDRGRQIILPFQHLYASFKEEAGVFQYATSITSKDPDVVHNFFQNALSTSFEGLVVKPLTKSAEYVPGKRRWLKIKKDSVEGLWDSLDLVPIGACYGYGKRAGVYGTFLLACYDCKSGEFQTICKAASGLTDEKLDHVFKSLSTKLLPNPLVWEVKAGGLTVSSKYLAAYGILEPDKGISLRFPRIHRFRPDKDPKQATSSDQVADMYIEQAGEDHPVNHEDYNDDVED